MSKFKPTLVMGGALAVVVAGSIAIDAVSGGQLYGLQNLLLSRTGGETTVTTEYNGITYLSNLFDDSYRTEVGTVLDASELELDGTTKEAVIQEIMTQLNEQFGTTDITNLNSEQISLLEQVIRDAVYNNIQADMVSVTQIQQENLTTAISATIENKIAKTLQEMNYNTDILEQTVNNHYTDLNNQLIAQELQIMNGYSAIENLTENHQNLTNTFMNTTNEMSAKEEADRQQLQAELDGAVEHYMGLVAPQYDPSKNYSIGDVVMNRGIIYRALVANGPANPIEPWGHGETWKATRIGLEDTSLAAMTAGTNWSTTGVYKAGEVVLYDNVLYKSLKNNNSEPLDDTTAWKVTSVSTEIYNESFKPEVEALIKQLEIQKSSTSLTQAEQDQLQADIDRLNDVMLNGTLEEIYEAITDSKVDIIQITQNFTETGATSTLNELINKLTTLKDSATTTSEQKVQLEALIAQLIDARDNATSSDQVNNAISAAQDYLIDVETAKMETDLENSINDLITKLTALKNSSSTTSAQKTEIQNIITQLTDARDNSTAYDQIQQLLKDAQTYITSAETGNAANDIQVEFQRMIERLQFLHDSTATDATQKAEIEALIASLTHTKDFETDYNAIRQALTDANSYINNLNSANADTSTANSIALLRQQIETLMNSDITTSAQKTALQAILDQLDVAASTNDLATIQQILKDAQEAIITTINQTNITSREIFAGDIYRSGTEYHIGDYVVGSDGKMYRCLREPCTLDPTADSYDSNGVGTYWQITNVTKELTNNTETSSEKWITGSSYNTGAYVTRNGELYRSLVDNNTLDPLEDTYNAKGKGSKWEKTNLAQEIDKTYQNYSDKWLASKPYQRGEFCIYHDQLYRAVAASTNVVPGTNTNYWVATTIGAEVPTYQYDAKSKTLYIYTQPKQTVK